MTRPAHAPGSISRWLPPTLRQRELLRHIDTLTKTRGYPPTIQELCEAMGVTGKNGLHEMLVSLRGRQLLTWEPGSPRTLVLTQAGLREAGR